MPHPFPDAGADAGTVPSGGPSLPRRTALAGLAVVAAGGLAGCTGQDRSDARSRPRVTRTSDATNPDVALAATVLAGERRVLARVEATLRRHRTLAPLLREARDVHRAHARLLAQAVPDGAGTTTSATPDPGSIRVPARPGAALAAVVRAEQRLGARHQQSAVAARSGSFARVVAVMGAAAVQQSVHLAAHVAGAGSHAG